MTEEKRTEKHEQARDSLPDELKLIFDDIVAHYKYHAAMRHGSPYVSYIVLADMVRSGWRRSADPCEDAPETQPG